VKTVTLSTIGLRSRVIETNQPRT